MAGDGLVRPLNAPRAAAGGLGVQPGATSPVVTATLVIVSGASGGVFVYDSTPGAGTLIASVTNLLADPFGNSTRQGVASYGPSGTNGQLLGNIISLGVTGSGVVANPEILTDNGGQNLILSSSELSGGHNALAHITLAPYSVTLTGQTVTASTQHVQVLPSYDTSGVTDASNINSALSSGSAVQLLPFGVYYINAPLVMKTESRLYSPVWDFASDSDGYGAGPGLTGGAKIIMVPAFSTATGDAALYFPDPGTGVQAYGAEISGITVEGNQVASGPAIHGLHVVGAWGACNLRGVMIHRPPADCFRFDVSPVTGYVPVEWYIDGCKGSAGRANGFYVTNNMTDSVIVNCNMSGNTNDGWHLGWGSNTRWANCKGENNLQNGWHLDGISATPVQFANCTSQLNQQNGWLFDNSQGGSGTGTYVLTGCRSNLDGQAAGTWAGFRSTGSIARIMGTGCWAGGTVYGALEESGSYGMCFTGSYLAGTTAATHDDGTNTHVLVNQSPVPF